MLLISLLSVLLSPALLFVLLSPGVLVTLPPVGSQIFMSGKTSLIAVLVHAVIFLIAFDFFFSPVYDPRYLSNASYKEGFAAGKSLASNAQCGVSRAGVLAGYPPCSECKNGLNTKLYYDKVGKCK